jgi:Fe-S cluster biosynthesis and repair protein YggX
MNPLKESIVQFRKMATDDPENELGHFRLGKALLEDGQHEEAVQSFRRTLELSPQFSKVYQMLGTALVKLGRRDEAVKVLKDGFAVADERGDNIPREEMAKMLVDLGEALPVPVKIKELAGPREGFQCRRPACPAGPYARQLAKPPMSDEVGRRIYETVCADCWEYWFKNVSIKVINEMRLDLSTERGQEVYDQIMRETLGLD